MFYKIKGQYAATKIKFVDDNDELTDQDIENALNERHKHSELGKELGDKKEA